jgi:hypothetical protein
VGGAVALACAAGAFWGDVVLLGHPPADYTWWLVGITSFALVGSLLVARAPRNHVSVLFFAIGLLSCVQAATQVGVAVAVEREAVTTVVRWVAWSSSWMFPPVTALLLVSLPLRFPTGIPLSRRWSAVERTAHLVAGLAALAIALRPGPLDEHTVISNPLGVAALDGVSGAFVEQGFAAMAALGLASLASVVLRYRRAGALERQQLKWFLSAVALLLVFVVTSVVAEQVLGAELGTPGQLLGMLALVAVPGSAAIAVLRYRLFEIDRLISRTLSYAVVTAILVGVYAAGVVGLGGIISPMTRDSDLAVAAATLLVAALFSPVRRKVQRAVDRRFDRDRYDAQQTVDAFSSRLRDGVDLDGLQDELAEVVGRTVQPLSVSLWLREVTR